MSVLEGGQEKEIVIVLLHRAADNKGREDICPLIFLLNSISVKWKLPYNCQP